MLVQERLDAPNMTVLNNQEMYFPKEAEVSDHGLVMLLLAVITC